VAVQFISLYITDFCKHFNRNVSPLNFSFFGLKAIHPLCAVSDMQVLHFTKTGAHVGTIETSHVCRETIKDNQLNDKRTIQPNKFFEDFTEGKGRVTYNTPPPLLPRRVTTRT
jgi:hypothetical protein